MNEEDLILSVIRKEGKIKGNEKLIRLVRAEVQKLGEKASNMEFFEDIFEITCPRLSYLVMKMRCEGEIKVEHSNELDPDFLVPRYNIYSIPNPKMKSNEKKEG